MIKNESDFSTYPGLDMMFAESCKPFLENIAAQIIADQRIDHERLAITAYAENKHCVSTLVNACKYITSEISRHTGINQEVYFLNLSGYNGNPCEEHKFPRINTPNLDFILFSDSFTDAKLLSHAHYFVSKQGVVDQKIKIAAVFYVPKIYSSLEFNSFSLDGKVFTPKSFSKKPDYVGQLIN